MSDKTFAEMLLDNITEPNVEGQEQPTPAEKQPDETKTAEPTSGETVQIDGLNVVYTDAEDGNIDVEYPPEYDEFDADKKAAFDRKVNDGAKTLAKLKQERMQQADKDRRITELEAKIAELTSKAGESVAEAPAKQSDPEKYWGVSSWKDVADLQLDDPEAYHRGLSARAAESAGEVIQRKASDAKLIQEAASKGVDYAELQKFAKESGITNERVALDYMLLKQSKEDITYKVRRKAPTNIPPKSGGEKEKPVDEYVELSARIGGYEI